MADRDDVATVPDPEAQTAIRRMLDTERYAIRERIGKGGMGEVLAAHDQTIGREVAIKRMLAEPSARAISRFLREARVQARLDHPTVVPVHELGLDDDGLPYFVMKLLSGTTLRALLRKEPMKRLLRAFVDVCMSIEYAHSRGVVHRDLKPENVMLGNFGEVYVLDWGVAKIVGTDEIESATDFDSDDELATRAGTVIGTPGYMSPEQARGQSDIDGRADVYALGCILFEIVTGAEWNVVRNIYRWGASDLAPEVEALCMEALDDDREKRPRARELAERLQHYLDGDRDIEARRKLADAHIETARAALVGDRIEQRATAMREAGVALALDPTRTDAAEIISKLVLEPPSEAPPEVMTTLEAERLTLLQRNAMAAGVPFVAFILFGVLILAFTNARLAPVVMTLALSTILMALSFLARRTRRLLSIIPTISLVLLGFMVVAFARMYPPFLVAPALGGLIAIVTPFTMQHFRLSSAITVTCVMLAAVGLPFAGELVGWLEPTFTFTREGILLHAGAVRGSVASQIAIIALYIFATVAFAGMMGYITRQTERRARRQLHLQAWHLRQLVAR